MPQVTNGYVTCGRDGLHDLGVVGRQCNSLDNQNQNAMLAMITPVGNAALRYLASHNLMSDTLVISQLVARQIDT
jgi:hypothetical protein